MRRVSGKNDNDEKKKHTKSVCAHPFYIDTYSTWLIKSIRLKIICCRLNRIRGSKFELHPGENFNFPKL
jgi:hypothetical protein